MKTTIVLIVLLIVITMGLFIAIANLPDLPSVNNERISDCEAAFLDISVDYLKAHPRLTCNQAIQIVNGGQ